MEPPWKAFPRIPWGSLGWRMGPGENFWFAWTAWYLALPEESKAEYRSQQPEAVGWSGFYEFCENGTLPPHYLEREARIAAAACPPVPSENKITDPDRVVWMIRHYLKKPTINVRVFDYGSNETVYRDPVGNTWCFVTPMGQISGPSTAYLYRYDGKLVGEDNLEVQRPIS